MNQEEKPDARTTMMLHIVKENNDHHSIILPLINFTIIEEKENKVILWIEQEKTEIKAEKVKGVILRITDDPYVQWALDDGHLGCFHLSIVMEDAEILNSHYLEIKCKKLQQKTIIPDRRMVSLHENNQLCFQESS